MILRKAAINEDEKILNFYKEVIESIKGSDFKPKWNEKHPDLEFLQNSIKKEELCLYLNGDEIVSSFILNNRFDVDYSNVKWQVEAKFSEITVIHTFAINPKYAGKDYARKIFNQIKNIANLENKKTIRIDIIDRNDGAQKVFKKLGFEYIDTREINHPIVGLVKFHLYEYPLKEK